MVLALRPSFFLKRDSECRRLRFLLPFSNLQSWSTQLNQPRQVSTVQSDCRESSFRRVLSFFMLLLISLLLLNLQKFSFFFVCFSPSIFQEAPAKAPLHILLCPEHRLTPQSYSAFCSGLPSWVNSILVPVLKPLTCSAIAPKPSTPSSALPNLPYVCLLLNTLFCLLLQWKFHEDRSFCCCCLVLGCIPELFLAWNRHSVNNCSVNFVILLSP